MLRRCVRAPPLRAGSSPEASGSRVVHDGAADAQLPRPHAQTLGMSTIVRAADAAQFLSVLPHLLGCTPRDSVVVVPLSQGRTLGVMRVDLPSETAAAGAAASIIGMACRIVDVEAVVLVVYTDAEISDDPSPRLPHPAVIAALRTRADECGLPVAEVFVVAANGWGSALSNRLPPGGHDRARIAPRDDLPPEAVDGPPAVDQAAGAQLPMPGAGRRRAVGQALRSLDAALETICGIPRVSGAAPARIDPAALEAACALDDLPALFERALSWNPDDLAPMDAASIGWCLARAGLRDVALVQWASDVDGGDAAMEAQRRWEDGELYPSDLAEVMWGDGPRPDAERLDAALRLARNVAALMPKKRRAGALAVCGWIAWARGRSTHADAYVRQALHADPRHGLAEIVGSFVAAGHLPDWAFRAR